MPCSKVDQPELLGLAVAALRGVIAAEAFWLARPARRSAASCLSSACWVESDATCAARRSAVVPRLFAGRVDTVTLCLTAILVSFGYSHFEFSVLCESRLAGLTQGRKLIAVARSRLSL
jgi:hypothetical protein